MKDQVHIEDLRVETAIGPDSWNQNNSQQCFLTLDMQTDFSKAAAGDDLNYTLNYAVISRDVMKHVQTKANWGSLGNLSKSITNYVMSKFIGIDSLRLRVQTRTGHIRSDDISCVINENRNSDENLEHNMLHISNLKMLTLIGVFTFERLQKQYITLDLKIPWPKEAPCHASYKSVIEDTVQLVENSNFLTVEALVESVAAIISENALFQKYPEMPIEVKVIKLNAITATSGVGVSCVRRATEVEHSEVSSAPNSNLNRETLSLPIRNDEQEGNGSSVGTWNVAYLAFGSNIGDKLQNVRLALDLLSQRAQIKIKTMSSLFESEPMYFADQDTYLNGCIKIETTYSPQELLKCCKEIEYEELKRIKKFDNGPRIIDLDIVMYLNGLDKQVVVDDDNLAVPHARMLERSFVLEPLCEILPPDQTHPLTTEPLIDHLKQLYSRGNKDDLLRNLVPIGFSNSLTDFLKFDNVTEQQTVSNVSKRINRSPTLLMGILNTTPDSFSDGGVHYSDVEEQLSYVKQMCQDAFKLQSKILIDIGGCSTRPKSVQVSEEIELERVIPIIKAIRACKEIPQDDVIISIDTYRSAVAREAVNAGANIINDISGGTFDPKMYAVVASNPRVGYVLSHIRGNISNMVKQTEYEEKVEDNISTYLFDEVNKDPETALIRTIGKELSEMYSRAIEKGISRWQIILDPGIGFAKNGKQNLEIIRQLPLLKNFSCKLENGNFVNLRNLPVLVGPSRKQFIGKITRDETPSDRDFATGAIITCCIGFGADIVRVHNVKECSKAVKLADALYKQVL